MHPMTSRQRRSNNQFKNAPLDLALQGGGSHGAFTWGVLDRLLQDDTLAIDGVSGTSAGALNAAVMATGWADGGRESARRALRAFWLDLAGQGGCFGNPAVTWPHGQASNPWVAWAALGGLHMDQNPWQAWTQQFLRAFSPIPVQPLRHQPAAPGGGASCACAGAAQGTAVAVRHRHGGAQRAATRVSS